MHYLLDTNILSYFLQGQTSIITRVGDAGGLSFLSISTITVAESMHGVVAMQNGAKKTRLLDSLEQLLATGIDVRPFSIDAARVFAEAKAKLETSGVKVSSVSSSRGWGSSPYRSTSSGLSVSSSRWSCCRRRALTSSKLALTYSFSVSDMRPG